MISVGRDTEVQMRDVANGKKGQTLLAHEHPIRAVAASPDGKFLASAGEETRVMLWDAQTGKLIRTLIGHIDFVNAVSFNLDGTQLASAGADGRIVLWDVKTGQLVRTIRAHSNEVNAVAFSRDGKSLASGSADSLVNLWDATTGQLIQSLAGHQAAVRTVAFSPNGQRLLSAGEDAEILVWDTATRQLVKQMPGTTNVVSALVFGPSGNLIAGSEDGEVTEWDVEKGQKTQIINVPLQPQSTNSAAIPAVSSLEPIPGSTGQVARPVSTQLAAVTQPNIFNRVLNWLIPAAEAAIPSPPGGPILVVTTAADPFGQYYAEVLRTEGFNEFAIADISTITNATSLAAYDVVILASTPLTGAQVTLFTNWVTAGGNLIAMKPDKQLAGLLGLTDASTTLSNAYLLVDTSAPPGNGIVGQTIQFHDTAELYTLNGATSVATLYNTATTATSPAKPAITLKNVGANGGQAAAFTYNLARSIVYTRQGNPAWAAQERDGAAPIRSDDKFYGNKSGDVQPDWVDLAKVAIPQADEQQRLLANLITEMNRDKKPLPRFWYFPNKKKAVVIMTGDDHGNNGTAGRFDQFKALSPAGCSVANWECVRGTSYIYPSTPLTNAQAAGYAADGFEVGLHVNTNCADYTPASLETIYVQQLAEFLAKYTSIPVPITQRHHCIVWSDWVTGATVQFNHGIRLDTSYYYWPSTWLNDIPGNFTGSAMPMRFVDLSGNIVDVFQATSQMTDESGQSYPFTVNTLLDWALGSEGYYGAYTINAHTDVATEDQATYTVNSALTRGVPVISSVQMLSWLDARNSSSFSNLLWNGSTLDFTVTPGSGATGLHAMLPTRSVTGLTLTTLTRSGAGVPFTTDTIKGIEYALFPAAAGAYTATYQVVPLIITTSSLTDGPVGVAYSSILAANGGIFPYTWSISNGALPTGLSLNPVTGAITGTPTAVGTFSFTVQVADSTNPVATTTKLLSLTVTPLSIWPGTAVPSVVDGGPDNPVEGGVKFRADVDGSITGIRFYKAATNTGTHLGHLWSSNGTLLASATFSGESTSGWQQVNFSTPVAITANTVYVASYHMNVGHYSYTQNYFASRGADRGPLHALADGVLGGNGVYTYGASSAFPNQSWQASNFWVDVAFIPGVAPVLQSIAVTPANPTISTGATQQFTATGTYSTGPSQNLTNQVTWASSNTGTATITGTGLATASQSAGTSTISAMLSGITASTLLTINNVAPTLQSIALTPVNPTIQTGAAQQFTATGTYSDGSTQTLTSQVTWSSLSNTVATIGASTGLALGVSTGTSTISATLSGITGSTLLTVQAPPLAITTASLPGGTMGVAYSVAPLAASGGTPPYTSWSITTGALPAGMSLNSSTGAISGTPSVDGTFSFTVQVNDSAGAMATKALSIDVANGVTNTGLLAPNANAPVTGSAGDNNGFQTTPANAYVSDGLFAVDTNSGNNTNTACTNTGKDKHNYYNYNFNLPAGATIQGIEVQLTAKVNSTTSSPKMCVQLSWDGGTTWTTTQSTATLSTTNATYTLGGTANTWGRTWTVGDLSNTNFRVRIIDVASSTARTFSLDRVAVRVTYQ